jgi:hypothetical protein
MKLSILLIAALFIVEAVNAQSPFKPLPKLAVVNKFAKDVFTPDSTIQAWRFIANIAAYAEPGNIAEAGLGYGYQWLKYDYTTQKWYANASVSLVAFAGGSVAPSTPSSIMSGAVMAGFLNNLFMVGPQYNFGTKQFGIAVSIGISLNN